MSEVWRGPSERSNPLHIPRTTAAVVQLVIVVVSAVAAATVAAWVGYHSDLGWVYTSEEGVGAGIAYGLLVGVPYGLHVYFWAPRRSPAAAALLEAGGITVLPAGWYLYYLAIGGWEFPLPTDFWPWFVDYTLSFRWEYPDGSIRPVGWEMHVTNGFACVSTAVAAGLLPWTRKTCPACDGRAKQTLIGLLYEPITEAVETTDTLVHRLVEDREAAVASWLALAPYPRSGHIPTARVRICTCVLCRGEYVTLTETSTKSVTAVHPVPAGSYLPLAAAVKRAAAVHQDESRPPTPAWHGDLLHIPKGATLPARCPACAEPGEHRQSLEFRQFGTPSLVMLLIAWPLALLARDSMRFEASYCAEHIRHLRRREQGGIAVLVSVLVPLVALFVTACMVPNGMIGQSAATAMGLLFLVSVVGLPVAVGIWWTRRYPRLVSKAEMTKEYVLARGFHPRFLDDDR